MHRVPAAGESRPQSPQLGNIAPLLCPPSPSCHCPVLHCFPWVSDCARVRFCGTPVGSRNEHCEPEPSLAPPQHLVSFVPASLVVPGTQHLRATFDGHVCFGRHALVGRRLAQGTGVRAGADLGTTAASRYPRLRFPRRRWHPAPVCYVQRTCLLRRARPRGVSAGSRNGRASRSRPWHHRSASLPTPPLLSPTLAPSTCVLRSADVFASAGTPSRGASWLKERACEPEPTLAPPQRLVAHTSASLVGAGAQHPRATFSGRVCFCGHALAGRWLAQGTCARAGARPLHLRPKLSHAGQPSMPCLGSLPA